MTDDATLVQMAAEQLEARGVHATLHVGFLNSEMRKVLRDRNKRGGAVYYYLFAVVGYTPDELSTIAGVLSWHHAEELALLGIENRDLRPDLWNEFIS